MDAKIPGIENFKGKVVHPQFWPNDLDYTDKKVAIIGSGATTITLLPAIAEKAEKVTMVQRSPSYIVSMSNSMMKNSWWTALVPVKIQRRLTRMMYLVFGVVFRYFMSEDSERTRTWLTKNTLALLPKSIPYDPHFKPRYKPWTQRICISPNGDFFEALREGKADIATGVIENVTEKSIDLVSGQVINADIIITATVSLLLIPPLTIDSIRGLHGD
jgi:cation diffusion facilitator CzcD-associated flavoprotein CzcO